MWYNVCTKFQAPPFQHWFRKVWIACEHASVSEKSFVESVYVFESVRKLCMLLAY